jgi:hypothetical protein
VQSEHEEDVDDAVNFPPGQSAQMALADAALKVPTGQLVQVSDASLLYVPAAQSEHEEDLSLL